MASRILTRRSALGQALGAAAAVVAAACSAPTTPSSSGSAQQQPTQAPNVAATPAAAGGQPVTIRAHMVQKQDVSDWIQTAISQDIDGFKAKNPNINLQLELVPGFTTEFIPKILSLAAGNQLGDVTWYAPRHHSQI